MSHVPIEHFSVPNVRFLNIFLAYVNGAFTSLKKTTLSHYLRNSFTKPFHSLSDQKIWLLTNLIFTQDFHALHYRISDGNIISILYLLEYRVSVCMCVQQVNTNIPPLHLECFQYLTSYISHGNPFITLMFCNQVDDVNHLFQYEQVFMRHVTNRLEQVTHSLILMQIKLNIQFPFQFFIRNLIGRKQTAKLSFQKQKKNGYQFTVYCKQKRVSPKFVCYTWILLKNFHIHKKAQTVLQFQRNIASSYTSPFGDFLNKWTK